MAKVPSADLIVRERRALELRRAGVELDLIARELGYTNASGPYKAIQRALRRTLQEPADELRAMEGARLDSLLSAVWPKAMRGDLAAVDRAMRLSESRRRLLGLDSPQRVEHTGKDGAPIEIQNAIDAEIRARCWGN